MADNTKKTATDAKDQVDEQISDEQLENVAGGVNFDTLRQDNLDKDASGLDKIRQENLDKD